MQTLRSKSIPMAGNIVMQFDTSVALGNVATAFCAGNHRPAFVAAVSDASLWNLFNKALTPPDQWTTLFGTKPDASQIALKSGQILEAFGGLLTELSNMPEPVYDVGKFTENTLADNGWSSRYVRMPALGYSRRLLIAPNLEYSSTDGLAWLRVPSPVNPGCQAITRSLFLADKPRISSALLPKMADFGKQGYKDQPIGTLLSALELGRKIFGWGGLYAWTRSSLHRRINKRLFDRVFDVAYAMDRKARVALDAFKENAEYVEGQRVHPLMSYVGSAAQTAKIGTSFGDHDLLLTDQMLLGDHVTSSMPSLVTAMISEAIHDFMTQDTPVWGHWDGASDWLTMGQAARMLKSLTRVLMDWDRIGTELGWRDVSGDIGMLIQNGANFMICDGEGYSDPPGGGLMGLRPVLSAGNIKSAGYETRSIPDFGILEANAIEYSTMVVRGHQTATGEPSAISRRYIPAGAYMGEEGIEEIMFGDAMKSDPWGARLVNWYASKAPSYLRQYYHDADGTSFDHTVFTQTSWDGVAASANEGETLIQFAAAYDGQMVKADGPHTVFLRRSFFYHRFPVANSISSPPYLFDELFTYKDSMEWEGHLLLGGETKLTHTTSELENLVDVAAPPVTSPDAGNLRLDEKDVAGSE